MGRGCGIDFGTTNSSAMETASGVGRRQFFPYGDDRGQPIPSVIAIDEETEERFTGRRAWETRAQLSEHCVCLSSIKNLLGDEGWRITIGSRNWSVTQLATEVFSTLKQAAETKGGDMGTATLAIPVGLNAPARRMLRHAARAAGIHAETFVSESTAAFFANYDELRSASCVAVFDWGGGTLDVSVLQHSHGVVTELATKGMHVAGDDIDLLLARRIHAVSAAKKGMEIAFEDMPARDRDNLIMNAEIAKRELGSSDTALILIPNYGTGGRLREVIEYAWFEELVTPTVNDAMHCLEEAIEEAGKTLAGVDRIVLVGGTSNLRPLKTRMREMFGDLLYIPDDPIWSVSKGAALLSDSPGKYVSAQDVGIVLANGRYFGLLSKGDVVEGWRRSIDFGITNTSNTLRVVFAGSRDIEKSETNLKVVEVPGYGFLEEKLRMFAEIDKDLVFRVRMSSTMRPDRDYKVWEYDKLKFSYDLG